MNLLLDRTPPLEILFKDDYLAVINKPPGLLVHRSQIDRHETFNAMALLRNQLRRRVYPVHRLDKPVAGVLVFALDPQTARIVTDHFKERKTHKTYHAIVRGHTPAGATIDYPLKEEMDPMTDRLSDPLKPPQSAITVYKTLANASLPYPVGRYPTARYSLVELTPITGRKHQIRRHLKHVYHPILGDTTHGDGQHNRFFREALGIRQLLLIASSLTLPHPESGDPLTLNAPISDGFRSALTHLQWPAALIEKAPHPTLKGALQQPLPAL